jgi:hypothetical protein
MKNSEKLEEFFNKKEIKENIEHRDVLLAIGAIIKTPEGIKLFSYLFKNLDVLELPLQGLEGNVLYEYLGFLRAGNSIYKLACEADFNIAASILSKLERERYEYKREQHAIENGYSDRDTD